MQYRVVAEFRDLQDKLQNHPHGFRYAIGDIYPREGLKVSDERMAELAGSDNKIGHPLIAETENPENLESLTVVQLKELAGAREIELDARAKKADIIKALSQ